MTSLNTVSITWDDQDRPVITVSYGQGDGLSPELSVDEWLQALAERLPDKSAGYLRALIDLNETRGHVSLAGLAIHLGAEKKDVDGWNRNLGRSIKAVVRDYGFIRPEYEDGTAQLFDHEWKNDANLWLYAVPEKFRPILRQALDAR